MDHLQSAKWGKRQETNAQIGRLSLHAACGGGSTNRVVYHVEPHQFPCTAHLPRVRLSIVCHIVLTNRNRPHN